ncbi:glycosyltransferase [Parabacteroides sp. 52]|uniref:glycosyltransferase n=1 Tax=unclassified Parabacteroides TaxID=2649774 RepID=UPI0013D151BB|nr:MULTISPECIES: glycosyltransferase [unclassified Parabacteroides]MDH6535172.1 glycosyltransferase involved in cell wall biosynthesis [Parabacteroides sp. PM5-20]NDV56211.1 glycosyltransferase [Parabacteroides sp. 52]
MKIAILSPFYPYRGGISQFSAMLYTTLKQEGHEVEAFNFKRLYPDFLFPGKTQYVHADDPAIALPSQRCLDSINPFSYSSTVKALKTFAPDVLIISYWMSFFVPAYAHIAHRMKKKCKIITLIHNAIPHEPRFFDKPMASLLFRQSDGFIVMSETVRDDLLRLCPQAKYIYNPHPLYDHFGAKMEKEKACQALLIPTDKKTLLFFGLIRDYKGLDVLIEAMGLVDDEDYQLLIAGESYGDFEKYRQQIETSPAKDRIHVHNRYVSDEELPVFFSAADILVLPYRSATQSGVVSVAYHYDMPMLATPVGDFRRSIEMPGTGIVVSDVSSQALAEGIQMLFRPEKLETCYAQIKKEKALLSWNVLTDKLVNFVQEL